MKKSIFKGIGALILTSVLLTNCSKVPQAEIDTASAAIEQSLNAGADIYMKDMYLALQDSMKAINESIEAKKSKLFKSYSDEVERLSALTKLSQEVQDQTVLRKEEILNEISVLTDGVKNLISLNYNLIQEAPRGKEGTTALQAIKDELAGIEIVVEETGKMAEEGDLLNALDKIKAADEQANLIYTELTEVISKYKANIRTR